MTMDERLARVVKAFNDVHWELYLPMTLVSIAMVLNIISARTKWPSVALLCLSLGYLGVLAYFRVGIRKR